MKAKELLVGKFPEINHAATGQRARQLLTEQGKLQKFVANRMQISESTLSLLLDGWRPWTARTAEKFLEALR